MEDKAVSAAVGTMDLRPVTSAVVANDLLSADVPGQLPGSVLGDRPHTLSLQLRRYDERLSGYLSATLSEEGRPLLVVPFYVELRRVERTGN
jgi:hypothetical protein